MFEERMAKDLALVLQAPVGPAVDVALLLSPAGEVPLRGIFVVSAQDATPGTARLPVLTRRPMLSLAEREVAEKGLSIKRGDLLRVKGQVYRVESPQSDGMGALVIKLLSAPETAPEEKVQA